MAIYGYVGLCRAVYVCACVCGGGVGGGVVGLLIRSEENTSWNY